MADAPLEIDVQTLNAMREKGEDHFLLDVREPSEHAAAAIQGSTLIPMGSLPTRIAELPKDKPVIIHCHHGGRSMRAITWLRQQGYTNVSNLAGGIDAWSQQVDAAVPRY